MFRRYPLSTKHKRAKKLASMNQDAAPPESIDAREGTIQTLDEASKNDEAEGAESSLNGHPTELTPTASPSTDIRDFELLSPASSTTTSSSPRLSSTAKAQYSSDHSRLPTPIHGKSGVAGPARIQIGEPLTPKDRRDVNRSKPPGINLDVKAGPLPPHLWRQVLVPSMHDLSQKLPFALRPVNNGTHELSSCACPSCKFVRDEKAQAEVVGLAHDFEGVHFATEFDHEVMDGRYFTLRFPGADLAIQFHDFEGIVHTLHAKSHVVFTASPVIARACFKQQDVDLKYVHFTFCLDPRVVKAFLTHISHRQYVFEYSKGDCYGMFPYCMNLAYILGSKSFFDSAAAKYMQQAVQLPGWAVDVLVNHLVKLCIVEYVDDAGLSVLAVVAQAAAIRDPEILADQVCRSRLLLFSGMPLAHLACAMANKNLGRKAFYFDYSMGGKESGDDANVEKDDNNDGSGFEDSKVSCRS